jgi:hypothetical protein
MACTPAARRRRPRRRPRARAGYNALRRASGIGKRPLEALAASRAAPRGPAARAPASGSDFLWQPLGPTALLMGQAAGTPWVTGRVNAIAVSDDGLRVYAASANGGIWYSDNGGDRWHSIGGYAATQFAGIKRPAHRNACGAVHATFGASLGDDVVFVGTGETHADPALGVPDSSGEDPHLPEGGIGILVADRTLTLTADDPWTVEATNLANGAVYRIARDAGGRTFAATRKGLWQRPADPAQRQTWVRPAGAPFDSFDGTCTDVLWTDTAGTAPPRLWVWVESGDAAKFGLWVRETADGDFARVATNAASPLAFVNGRATLAAAAPPSRLYVHSDHGGAAGTTAGLYRVTNPVAGTAPQAQYVSDAPNVVGGQGFYDIAIAVDPSNPDRVALGGSYFGSAIATLNTWMRRTPDDHDLTNQEWDGAIVIADITSSGGQFFYGTGTAGTNYDAKGWQRVGLGVHADVHELRYADGGRVLWTANDGGCARALRANTATPFGIAAFHGRGEGMGVCESNFIAGHPTLEGRLLCGLQDNGVGEHLSGGAWVHRHFGDAGDVLIDRVQCDRWIAQYNSARWADDGSNWLVGPGNDGAAFYSGGDVIEQTRPTPPAGSMRYTQYLIGTTRLWYREGVTGTWVTLPSGTGAAGDDLGEQVRECRWQTPDIAWVLTANAVLRYVRAANSHQGVAGTLGDWATAGIQRVLQKNVKNKDDTTEAAGPVRDAAAWTEIACNVLADGTGALYLGTSGHADKADVDTLWWFDGTLNDSTHWFPTQLRATVPAPVTAIVVDPALPAEVWVGTTVGVWHGVRTQPAGQPPQWQWTQRVNGLPEAAVEDLELFQRGTLKLLRAGIGSRGVWEMRLDVTAVADATYVRAHEDDLRHALPSHDRARDNATERSWHGSPDVRPRVKARALAAPPAATPWHRVASPQPWTAEQMRRFQCALRSRTGDRRILCDGEWDPYFSEVLRDHGAPTVAMPATGVAPNVRAAYQRVQITRDFWNTIVAGADALAEPWGTGVPTLVELLDMKPALAEGTLDAASCTLPPRPCQVDIVVHHRGLTARPGADVRVTLLKWLDPRASQRADPDHMVLGTGNRQWPFAAAMPWTAAVTTMMNSADGASAALTAGWSYVGTTNATRRRTLAGQTLQPLEPGIATFDVDFTGVANNRLVMLVAVIRAGSAALALPAASLRELALGQPTVAVRSVRVRA